MYVVLFIIACVLIVFVCFCTLVNVSFRIAYFFYRIPKIHFIVEFCCFRNRDYLKESILIIPESKMCAIDDMGWMEGGDRRSFGGPSRLITKRDPTIEDYQMVNEIAKTVGTRLLGLFVLSDFDQEKVCAKTEYNFPKQKSNITEYGINWAPNYDKTKCRQVMEYLYEVSANIEFGLHGVRHEHFFQDGYVNAEWANGQTGYSWGRENAEIHCKCFNEILRQYFPADKCSFPQCFVPPSHAFSLDSNDAEILHKYGVKYACSSCAARPTMKSIQYSGVFKDGILFVDRTELKGVNKKNNVPKSIPLNSWIGTHFPNYWGKSTKRWVKFLENINKNYSTMLGKNSAENYSQWLYNHYCAYQITLNHIALNNLHMPKWAYQYRYLTGIWLKVHLHKNQHLTSVNIPGMKVAGYYEDQNDNGFVYLIDVDTDCGALKNVFYEGSYLISDARLNGSYLWLEKETYSVLGIEEFKDSIKMRLRIYGKHIVRLICDKKILKVIDSAENQYDFKKEMFGISFSIQSRNMMGEEIDINIYHEYKGGIL